MHHWTFVCGRLELKITLFVIPFSEQDKQILNTRTENNFIYGTRQ